MGGINKVPETGGEWQRVANWLITPETIGHSLCPERVFYPEIVPGHHPLSILTLDNTSATFKIPLSTFISTYTCTPEHSQHLFLLSSFSNGSAAALGSFQQCRIHRRLHYRPLPRSQTSTRITNLINHQLKTHPRWLDPARHLVNLLRLPHRQRVPKSDYHNRPAHLAQLGHSVRLRQKSLSLSDNDDLVSPTSVGIKTRGQLTT
jgi:hypothetical protein